MSEPIFTGAATALITPMNQDGTINYQELAKLIEDQIKHGIDALVTCGTTAESTTFTDEEHIEVMRFTIEKVAGRVPVIAGVGSNDTRYALWLTREAAAMGADAMLHVTPYYNKTTDAGLIRHFTRLADETDVPTILYNVPSRTGMNIKPQVYKELSKHPNIVATKEANGDLSSVAETMWLCGDDLHVYSGNDDQIVPILSLGGKGVISVLSNVLPAETHQLCQAWFDGDVKKSAAMQLEFFPLIQALFCEVNPIPVKEAMNFFGWQAGPCREPLVPMQDSTKGHLHTLLKAVQKVRV